MWWSGGSHVTGTGSDLPKMLVLPGYVRGGRTWFQKGFDHTSWWKQSNSIIKKLPLVYGIDLIISLSGYMGQVKNSQRFLFFSPPYTTEIEGNLILSRSSGAHGGSGKLEFVLVVNELVQAVWLSLRQHEVRTLWGAVHVCILIKHTAAWRCSHSAGATRQSGNSSAHPKQNKSTEPERRGQTNAP